MYEDRIQNYDPEMNEEYLKHSTSILLPHHLPPHVQSADYHSYKNN